MSVTRNSKLLCPICTDLKKVVEIAELITLECGNTRPEILPLIRGRVSIENINSRLGRRLFPPVRDEVRPEWIELRADQWR